MQLKQLTQFPNLTWFLKQEVNSHTLVSFSPPSRPNCRGRVHPGRVGQWWRSSFDSVSASEVTSPISVLSLVHVTLHSASYQDTWRHRKRTLHRCDEIFLSLNANQFSIIHSLKLMFPEILMWPERSFPNCKYTKTPIDKTCANISESFRV